MKVEMESKEIRDIETGVTSESNSKCKEDAKENTSGTSTNQSISNGCELKVSNGSLKIEDSQNHRQNIQYSSESSDFETDESSDSDEFFKNLHKNVILPSAKLPTVVKTKGELLPFDLPPVEDLRITEKVTNLQKIGNILHTVIAPERNEFFVIVEADGNSNPLDEDSVLFLASGKPLGKIHDVFGNVNKPNYVVRFNNAEDIDSKGVAQKQDVFYSPSNSDLTHYVLVDALKQQKGSDASWKDNNEPPADQIDYSDDEQEKMAKRKRKAKNRKNDRDCDSEEEEVEDVTPIHIERRRIAYNQERTFQARSPRSKFRSPMPGPPRSYTSPRSFDSTPSSPSTFNPGLQRSDHFSQQTGSISLDNRDMGFQQRNAHFSQPTGPVSLNNRDGGFQQRNVPSPQSFGSFPQSNVPSPSPFGPFSQSRVPTPQSIGTFPPSSVPSPQPFSPPPNSHVFMQPNVVSPNTLGSFHQTPLPLMHAPQNNVPLQQQIRLQSQQPGGNFLSHPPPNFNSNQDSRTFLHQNNSFTPPTFGALPAAVQTMPNASNQPFANQILFRTNGPHSNFSGNINISQPRNILPMNNPQNPPFNMMQTTSANPFIFQSQNTQHNNNMHTLVTQPSFGPNQLSPCKTPPFIANQSALPSPCSTPPFVLCPTPPLPTQQCFSIQSNQHPVLPSQMPPPAFHQFSLNLPAVRNPMPPQHYPYS